MNFMLLTADAAQSDATGSILSMVLIYGVLIFALWFFFMRPQKKEQKRTQEMLSTLENGDIVCTTSGFYGTIIDIQEDMVIVEFGNNRNCRIPMEKSAIAKVEKPGQASSSDSESKQ